MTFPGARTTIELPFVNRAQAARHLADRLRPFGHSAPLVLAIPRGGVPIGRVVADRLGGDLDVVLVRKLGAPFQPEVAIGAVDESGWVHLAPDSSLVDGGPEYVQHAIQTQRLLLSQRAARYRGQGAAIDCAGRVTIVVDDGLATGSTMIAALHAVRARKPAYLVCAVPVASERGLRSVEPYADEIISLATPLRFGSVGNFYLDFRAVSDDEVVALLKPRPSTRSA